MKALKIILIVFLFVAVFPLPGQYSVHSDTLRVSGGNYVFINGKRIVAINDTILIIPEDSDYEILPISEEERKSLKNTMKFDVDSSSWYSDIYHALYGSIFTTGRAYEILDTAGFVLGIDEFTPFAGHKISSIRFKKVDLLEGSIWDTTRVATSWLAELAISLHVYTRDYVLRRYLDFKEGDQLSPSLLSDNERFIRSQPFIEDVRIVIVPRDDEEETVDIVIIVKDRFSIGASFGFSDIDKFRVGVFDQNLFGHGVEFNNILYYNKNDTPKVGYEGLLKFNNLVGNHIDGYLQYITRYDVDLIQARLDKRFLNPQTKYAGGAGIKSIRTFIKRRLDDTTEVIDKYKLRETDFWLGRSFQIGGKESRENIVLTGRYNFGRFIDHPEVHPDSNFFFHDRSWILASIGYNNVNYYKSRLIYGYGQTEDVPTGIFINFVGGYGESQFNTGYYGGISFKTATLHPKFGYLSWVTDLGGFYRRGHFENGILRFKSLYFTNLINLWRMKVRQFIYFDYTKGFDRYTIDRINISDRNGIRGLSGFKLEGLQRLTFKFETLAFSPWTWYEFKTAFFIFADIGFIGSSTKTPFEEEMYTGIGGGIRTKNNSLTFDTFQFRFAYYPKTPPGVSNIRLDFIFNLPRVFVPLSQGGPEIIQFK